MDKGETCIHTYLSHPQSPKSGINILLAYLVISECHFLEHEDSFNDCSAENKRKFYLVKFLANKGFSWSLVNLVLDRYIDLSNWT